ncbi:MAG: hypothetical protein FWD13_08270, partial [Treponema sp.]|nr:hypothetical protein [Treponema sp.]
VKVIDLNYQSGLKEIPPIIGECKMLEKLNISHTGITVIPDFVFSLPNLFDLSCCCSELSGFPKGVSKSLKLQRLHIRINKDWTDFKEIPILPDLKLFIVDLYKPSALPENLGLLKNLEQLVIVIKYAEAVAVELPVSLAKHPALKEISITNPFTKNRITFNLVHALKILSTCSKLESVKLSGFAVGKEHLAFALLRNLKTLVLRHLLTEGNIFNSIKDLHKLEVLGIFGSGFKVPEIPDIFKNMRDLREFSLTGNMVRELPSSFYDLTKLKVLELGCTGISALDSNICSLQNLENVQIYDSLLEKLPDVIFTMPNLKILNIEENIFNEIEIKKIKEKLKTLEQNGQKVEFTFDRQGFRRMVKKLRVFDNLDSVTAEVYAKHCLNAVNENPFAIKYVNTDKLKGTRFYGELCIAAIKRSSCTILEVIKPEALNNLYYFRVCMEAARCNDIGTCFKLIRDDLLSDNEYLQVCVEASLHNQSADFISNFNTEVFQKRFDRKTYEHLCWVAVLHNPKTVSRVI